MKLSNYEKILIGGLIFLGIIFALILFTYFVIAPLVRAGYLN